LTIHWLDSVGSTQRYLLDALKSSELTAPVCIAANEQTAGSGSRGNSWDGLAGNLFFSFAVARSTLPKDLRLESSSIYLTYLLKEVLSEAGSQVWLKWPNDFYLGDKKIGGAMTNLYGEILVCGIGLNMKQAPDGFEILDIDISQNVLLDTFFKKLKKSFSWKQIFSKFELEFERSRMTATTVDRAKVSLKNAILLEDGSIECNGQRIYSLR